MYLCSAEGTGAVLLFATINSDAVNMMVLVSFLHQSFSRVDARSGIVDSRVRIPLVFPDTAKRRFKVLTGALASLHHRLENFFQ